MIMRFYSSGLAFLLVAVVSTAAVNAQLVREVDPNCVPALTPRSELLIPYIDEYFASYGADVGPDGQQWAIAAVNRLVLFDTQTFEPVQTITLEPEHSDSWRVVAWSPDGERLAVYIGPRNGILILNIATAEVEHLLPTDDHYTLNAYTVAWSPDGTRLSMLGDVPWQVWHVEREKIIYETIPERNNIVYLSPLIYGEQYMAAWSPDGKQLAVPDEGNATLLDTATWSTAATLPMNFDHIVSLEWSNAGRLFVTDSSRLLDVWDPAREEHIEQVRVPASIVAQLSLDETLLAVAGFDDIAILDPETLEILTTLTSETMWGSINNLDWLDDERVLVYGEYSTVEVWNIKTGEMEHVWHINCLAP
jgi:WD40 repeat protein